MKEIEICEKNEIPKGGFKSFPTEDGKVMVAECDGKYYATATTCTHQGADLSTGEMSKPCIVQCPWHGAEFDLKTGQAVTLPAIHPLEKYAVEVKGDKLVLILEEEADDNNA